MNLLKNELDNYPDVDLVGIRDGKDFTGIDDVVLAHGHGVALDLLRYAFCGARFEVETHRFRRHCQYPYAYNQIQIHY